MQVHRSPDALPKFTNAVITVGTFDGVHRGHQQLIHRIKKLARAINGESVLVTFEPHPRTIVYPEDTSLYLLSTLQEKIDLLNQYKVDHLVVVPFTKEFSRLSAREYVDQFLVNRFHPAVIVIGYNHQFGHHRDGNIELLKKLSDTYHFTIEEIPKQLIEDIEVSSSRIRLALLEGDVKTASHLLGHHYFMEGIVVRGKQLGRKLGFPTANVQVPDKYKLIPGDGVYAVKAALGQHHFKGAASIGFRPTVNGNHRTIEAYLFDFNKDIYDQLLKITFIEWIREERKFESVEKMVEEMKRDVERAKVKLNNN
ncbi:MAG: bifunctional riboflavin kinase/FAD synthetase [Chitinophagales bacterium]|nr:bifunctional riboflavin kinase/FAD synthetase [Chitinophagales bacterium]